MEMRTGDERSVTAAAAAAVATAAAAVIFLAIEHALCAGTTSRPSCAVVVKQTTTTTTATAVSVYIFIKTRLRSDIRPTPLPLHTRDTFGSSPVWLPFAVVVSEPRERFLFFFPRTRIFPAYHPRPKTLSHTARAHDKRVTTPPPHTHTRAKNGLLHNIRNSFVRVR